MKKKKRFVLGEPCKHLYWWCLISGWLQQRFTSLVKKILTLSQYTASFTERWLVSKTLGDEVKKVLDDAIKLFLSNKDQFTPECLKIV
jgi:hypothetical protein